MTFKTGLVGTGFIADAHARGYGQAEGIELIAAADIDEEGLHAFGDEWSVPEHARYTDHREMLEAESLDSISVTTPSFLHHDHVIDAVSTDTGPAVIWCEKPIALSVEDADEMISACAEAEVELVINHTRRFSDSYTALREQMQEGFLGDVQSITIQSVRELLRNGTHTVDLLKYLLGTSGTAVTGHLTNEHGMGADVEAAGPSGYDDCGGCGTLVLADGTYVSIDHTAPRPTTRTTIQIVGTDGTLRIEDGGDWAYRRNVEADTPYGTELVDAPIPDDLAIEDRDMFTVGANHVVELLDGTTENRSPGRAAAEVLELIVAMFISHYTGSRITLPLEAPLRDVEVFSW